MNDATNEPRSKSSMPIIALIAVLLLAAGAGAYYYFSKHPATNDNGGEMDNTSADLALNGEGPVARVDGQEISREEYRRNVEQIVASYTAQGVDASSTEAAKAIKDQAVNALVNRELVYQAAVDANLSVDDSAVDKEYQNVLSGLGGEEGMAAALASANMSQEDLRADIKKSLLINQYLESKLGINEIAVSDEEVQAYYDNAKANNTNTEVPPLSDVHDLIQSQLLAEKQQQAIEGELQTLRADADIEILI